VVLADATVSTVHEMDKTQQVPILQAPGSPQFLRTAVQRLAMKQARYIACCHVYNLLGRVINGSAPEEPMRFMNILLSI